MKKFKWVIIILTVFSLFLAACNQSDSGEQEATDENETAEQTNEETEDGDEVRAENEEIILQAETFIDQLSAGDYEIATENFDETMTSQFTADDLEELWESLREQLGDFIDYEYNTVEEADDFQVVLLTGIFNDADITFQVTFDADQQIAGFYVV